MTEINLCNEVLENAIEVHRNCEKCGLELQPLEMVSVQAMEELLKYREIGTIEECNNAMCFELAKENKELSNVVDEYLQYVKLGTVEEFKALKAKSVAKKPIRNDLCSCPICGTYNEVIRKRRNTVAFDTVYCWHCGQAIEIKRE